MSDIDELEDQDPWDEVLISIGDYVTHPTAVPEWWELVVAWGPDGRMITVDPNNRLHRYSDPTEQWELIDPPDQQVEEPRGFTAMDRRSDTNERREGET